MTKYEPDVTELAETAVRLAQGVQDIEALLQQAYSQLGARAVPLSVQANDLFAALRHDLALNEHYGRRLNDKLIQYEELSRTATLLNSSLDVGQVLQDVIDTIIALTGAARAYLMLQEEDSLTIQVARNWDHETLSEQDIVFSRSIVRMALDQGEITLSADVQADPRFRNLDSVFKHHLRSVLCIPLLMHGKTIGLIYADNGDQATAFSPETLPVLISFASQAAVAIENARLFQQAQAHAGDLQSSRGQIILAREEERRRLRRDLHDGLGPILGSFTLKIDAARRLVKQRPDAADDSLLQLKQQVKHAIDDVRRIVYGLRPAPLDELGLVGALREYAQQTGELAVAIDAPEPLPPLPAAVEVAVYRIATEALTNVVRHAQAGNCSIRLQIEGALTLEITDDGCGLPEGKQSGVGLNSMGERAAELGGTLTVESPVEGGTRVMALLPL